MISPMNQYDQPTNYNNTISEIITEKDCYLRWYNKTMIYQNYTAIVNILDYIYAPFHYNNPSTWTTNILS